MPIYSNGLRVSVFKACESEANKIWAELSATEKGRNIFKRKELPEDRGFEIFGPYKENGEWVKNELGKIKRKVILRFTNNPAPKIEWDEKAISIA